MRTALFIGRFQPLHNGHLQVIKRIFQENDFTKIVIGSSKRNNTMKNPFSYEQRKRMLVETLPKGNYEILPVPDINDDAQWVGHVKSIVKDFDVVYSGNELVIKLFLQSGTKVEKIDVIEPYSSTLVRKLIFEGKDVSHLIPASVLKCLKEIDAINVIQSVQAR